MRGSGTTKTRQVICTYCSGCNEVGLRAMSVFCAHCRKRIILEDYNIKTFQAVAGYATCGDVIVHKKGLVTAPIRATNLVVKGVVKGDVTVRGRVEISATGSLMGRVCAPSLRVDDGASLDGFCEIRPLPVTAAKSAVPAADPVAADPAAEGGVRVIKAISTRRRAVR